MSEKAFLISSVLPPSSLGCFRPLSSSAIFHPPAESVPKSSLVPSWDSSLWGSPFSVASVSMPPPVSTSLLPDASSLCSSLKEETAPRPSRSAASSKFLSNVNSVLVRNLRRSILPRRHGHNNVLALFVVAAFGHSQYQFILVNAELRRLPDR